MFEESDVRNFEMSDDKRFIDLSFESLNPINNSFTEGIKESRSTGGNRSQING